MSIFPVSICVYYHDRAWYSQETRRPILSPWKLLQLLGTKPRSPPVSLVPLNTEPLLPPLLKKKSPFMPSHLNTDSNEVQRYKYQ